MSLGLGDLKKKQKAAQTNTTRVVTSQSARPWSADGLNTATRPSKGHKKQEVSDIAMNEDAASLQAAPLFYLEVIGDSRLARVEETLVKIEERVTRALEGPLKAAQLFFPKFFAQ
ncbi:MAG: hypothetical protein V4760_15835 [Bdellovibrionota bacterium]